MSTESKFVLFLVSSFLLFSLYIPQESYSSILETQSQTEMCSSPEVSLTTNVWITAYSSTPDETDDTPFITASGERVRDGIVAANFLPFDTKIRIPKIFADKVFVVKDRMHRRKTNFIDVWMPSKELAQEFGIHYTAIEILSPPELTLLTLRYSPR